MSFFYKDLKTCKDHGACPSIALTVEQLQELAPQYPTWQLDLGQPNKITREFKFETYQAALTFVNQVAKLAEATSHHPDIVFKWGSVQVEYWTHNANGLTMMDFEAAGKIDEIDSA